MTAVDRPDNGQDEGRDLPSVADSQDQCHIAEVLHADGTLVWGVALIKAQQILDRLASARAGAGEQQREQVARWLYDTFGLESAHWETAGQGSRGYFSARADELLALLAPQSDGEAS